MRVRMFTTRGSTWTWKLDVTQLEREISGWLASDPAITVREIRHDLASNFWMPPQLVISIYYD